MEYVNDNCTNIYIKQDVWQTWQFDIQYLQSFVEREMIDVSQDFPGSNREPEGLEFGEPKIQATADIEGFLPMYVIAYATNNEHNPTSDGLPNADSYSDGGYINGMASGIAYCFCASPSNVLNVISVINSRGLGDLIVSVFTVPRLAFLGYSDCTFENITNPSWRWIHWFSNNDEILDSQGRTISLNGVGNSIDGYVPVNKKILSYPYCYLTINPTNGNSKIFKYENFSGNPQIKIISEVNPNPSIAIIPQNYNGKNGDVTNEASFLTGYPTVSYQSDKFNAWLAQNQKAIDLSLAHERKNYAIGIESRGIDMLTNTGAMIGYGMTGKFGEAISSAGSVLNGVIGEQQAYENYVYGVKSQMAQKEAQSLVPSTANVGTSATLIGYDLIGANLVIKYGIRREFAEKIDKYFSAFGYSTNQFKIPNINNRPTWNYVKTLNCNINGNIPQADLAEIKEIFNSGITLWHSTSNFKNYYANNR